MELKQCVIFIILMYICGVSYAEDSDAQLLAKGMWRDTSTGLIWMRCSLGQTWTGETCTGKAKKYTWPSAMLAANKSNFAGKNDWQLPSIEDLANIRKCTTGEKEKTYSWKFPGNNGEDIPYSYSCNDDSVSPTIDQSIFPETNVDSFWTASNYNGMAWIIDYNYGRPQNHNESYDYYVRLVRSTKSFDIYTANLEKIKPREGEILAAQKQWDVEALATEKQREIEVLEGEKRLKIEKQQREVEALAAKKQREVEAEHLKREAALSPQAMYLQAGKYDRNGQKTDAIRLYEILVDKYPDNSLAIQATNRLVAMQADEEAASRLRSETNRVINEANRQQSQSSAECRRRKEAYANSCGSDSYCYTRARSICSE